MLRPLFLCLCLCLLFPAAAPAQPLGVPGMPDGYSGFAFGAGLEAMTAANLVPSRQEFVPNEMYGDYTVAYYVRATANPSFENVPLLAEEFGVVDGSFTHVLLTAQGREAYAAFLDQAAKAYGTAESTPFSTPEYPDCVKAHHATDHDGIEEQVWVWGVAQSDYVFAILRIAYDPAKDTATYRLGWDY